MNTTTHTSTITLAIVDALYDEWVRLQNLATNWDEAMAEPHASEVQAAHLAYLRAETARTGISNDGLIALLYGKEALTPVPQPAPVTPVETPAPVPETRIRGTVQYWNGARGSIFYEGCLETIWFTRILGGMSPRKDMVVEFEIGYGNTAQRVVAVGNAQSEAAYQALLSKPAPAPAPKAVSYPARKPGKRFTPKPSSRIDFSRFDDVIGSK